MPVLVTLIPPGAASLVTVRLVTGHGAGVYLHFATFAFQVPTELSWPHAVAVVVSAKANNASESIFFIPILLVTMRARVWQGRLWVPGRIVRLEDRPPISTLADSTKRGLSLGHGD